MGEQNNTWTPARLAILQEFWGILSAKAIAERIGEGISRNAVIGKAFRLGLSIRAAAPPTKQPPEKKPVAGGMAASQPLLVKTRNNAGKSMGLRREVASASPNYMHTPPKTIPEVSPRQTVTTIAPPPVASPRPYPPAARAFNKAAASHAGQNHPCRWPMGDPLKPGFHFCESTAVPNTPYCYDHACIAYQGAKKKPSPNQREGTVAE